jgi:hypothetical protein
MAEKLSAVHWIIPLRYGTHTQDNALKPWRDIHGASLPYHIVPMAKELSVVQQMKPLRFGERNKD